MQTIIQGCQHIMDTHRGGQTEHFYGQMLACYLYDRDIPFLMEGQCFTFGTRGTPVLVGRIDMEVAHSIILEFKVGPRVTDKNVEQLMRYVKARQQTGMDVKDAAVICVRDDHTVEVKHYVIGKRSRYFSPEATGGMA